MLNNYSKCLCVSTALQTSLKRLLENAQANLSLVCEPKSPDSCWNWQFLQSFLGKLYENPAAIKAIIKSVKQLSMGQFGQTLFVECESHDSYFSEQYTGLNCIYSDKKDNWHLRQTWHFLITAVCHAECMTYTFNMASIHDIRFSSDCQ